MRKDEKSNTVRVYHRPVPDGRSAVTLYQTLQTRGELTLLEVELLTGRTHQIRVHLSHIGCPIVGDYLYGKELPELKDRFALHSAHLRCTQPITGQVINITEPLPKTLQALIDN